MVIESVIPSETLQAYSETDYRVYADHQSFVLRIGEHSLALGDLFSITGVDSCVFITAYNPYSQKLSHQVNQQRNNKLAKELYDKGLKYFAAEGKHSQDIWPYEPSYLVFGLTLFESIELAKKYEQNAIVWCGLDLVPQLVLLR